MMPNSTPEVYKNTSSSILQLIGEIDSGKLALPDLQRPFVWPDKKVRNLFDSLYNKFPVGSITLWRCTSSNKSHYIGLDNKEHVTPFELIIDGQQRLTSLYSVMLGKPVLNSSRKEKRIRIAFNPLEEKFEVYGPVLNKNPEWLTDISELYTTPKQHAFETAFVANLKAYRDEKGNPLTDEEEELIPDRLDKVIHLRDTILQIIEIQDYVDEECVSDIFVRLNSSAVLLRQHDFILNLFSLYWEDGRDKIEEYCTAHIKTSLAHNGNTIDTQSQDIVRTLIAYAMNRAHLKYAYKLLRGADFNNKGEIDEKLREERFAILAKKLPDVLDETNWDRFWNYVILPSGYITAKMITSHATVFYTYALYLIALDRFGNQPAIERLLALWFFFASLTSLYGDESVMEAQLNALENLKTFEEFKEYLVSRIDESFTNDYFEVTLTGSNGLAASGNGNNAWLAYNAALIILDTQLLFSQSGNTLKSLLQYSHTRLKKRMLDKHHLFPRNYLKSDFGYPDSMINQMANYSFIDWIDNEIIKDAPPSVYYSEDFILKNIPLDLKTRWESENALPSGWESMTYEQFLTERRKLMSHKIKSGYEILKSKI